MVRRSFLPPWLLYRVSGNRTAGRGFQIVKSWKREKIIRWEAPSVVEPRFGACRSRAPPIYAHGIFNA